ncbi:MAG: RNA 3'-terminal phosphate cyclase [Methanobacteriaceae archaeon]|nr:RNA 3'-terminal phosphate cyclase [Methanobacteriaceae archaeon]
MIEIDGSFREGGGALLRVSTALSALTGKAFCITNIRARRPKPGLMMQHLNAVNAIGKVSKAKIEGLCIGSTEMKFIPGSLRGSKFKVDVQTAGSTSLILQAFIIPAIFAPEEVEITIRGGTDVPWAPAVDYLRHVTLPVLQSMGVHTDLELLQRGYYPRGGGLIKAKIQPVGNLQPLNILDLELDVIKGISYSNKLPLHVAHRQAESAKRTLHSAGYPVEIEINTEGDSLGPGSGLVLWTEFQGGNIPRIGASSLGQPGKRAEIVGKEAANKLLSFMSSAAALDKYMGDQIIPYLAIAGSSRVKIAELTNHTLTNIYAAQKFMDCQFQVEGELGEVAEISIK